MELEKKTGIWDITGKWQISCKGFKGYNDEISPTEYSIDIHSSVSGKRKEIWGIFNFGIVTGIMRFMGPKAPGQKNITKSLKRKRTESEEQHWAEHCYEEEEEEDPTFRFPPFTVPSPKNHK